MNKETFPTRLSMLASFLRGSAGYFLASVVFASLASLFDLLNPKIVAFVVDHLLESGNRTDAFSWIRGHLFFVAVIVTLFTALGALSRYLYNLFNAKGAEKLVAGMRNRLFGHIQHLPFSWFMENPTGDIIQRCTSDVETVKMFLSEQLTGMLRIVVMLAIAFFFMCGISLKLTVPAAVFVPVIFLYSLFFHRGIGRTFLTADEEEGKLSSIAQENLTGVRVVRAFGRERYEEKRFARQNTVYTGAYKKLGMLISIFWSVGDFISGLQVMIIVALGAVMTVRGELTPGSYIAFVSYNAMIAWPVRMLGRVISDMSKAGVSVDRIRDIMNAVAESDPAGALCPPMDRDIEFSHVTFSYRKDMPPILDDVSFTVKAGTTFGILGGTGSGKSTLAALLLGLYPLPEGSGTITVGGVDVRGISLPWLRGQVALVMQEPFLFSGTIRENIAIARKDAVEKDIIKSAEISDLVETINNFTDKYDTVVGERGVTLSGGQKQRTAIAQAVIRDTPVLVFDDALSAVDAETDVKIRHALREEFRGKTVILIAHRITTLMEADQILILDHGKAAGIGSHEELYAANPIYRKVCDIQSGTGEEAENEDF